MAHAGHEIIKCECGLIIAQCRCPDRNKPVRVVGPCAHTKEERLKPDVPDAKDA